VSQPERTETYLLVPFFLGFSPAPRPRLGELGENERAEQLLHQAREGFEGAGLLA
jgi:hypothetical protein